MSELSDRARLTGRVGAIFAFAATSWAYITGQDLWLVLLLCTLIPGVPLYVRFYSGRFRRYRFLVGIYLVAGGASMFEYWQFGHFPENIAKTIDLPPGAGEMQGIRQFNLSHVLYDLYPQDTETLVRNAQYGPTCIGDDSSLDFSQMSEEQAASSRETLRLLREQHPYCLSLQEEEKRSPRQWYELALSAQPKKHEEAYYHYVRILLESGAAREDVDAAAENWRRVFPYSRRLDPRDLFTRGAWFKDDADNADGES